MAHRNNTSYVRGRGFPSYLIDRIHDRTSVNSESTIFISDHSIITSVNDTKLQTNSSICFSSSSYNMASVLSSSDIRSNSEQSSHQNEMIPRTTAMNNMLDDTRNNSNVIESQGSSNTAIYESVIPRSVSYMDIGITSDNPWSNNQFYVDTTSPYFFDPTTYTDPTNMFTPYVSHIDTFHRTENELENNGESETTVQGKFLILMKTIN